MLLRFPVRPSSGRGRPLEVTDVTGRECPRGFDFMYGEWMRDEIESGYLPRAACGPDMMILLRQAGEHSEPVLGPRRPRCCRRFPTGKSALRYGTFCRSCSPEPTATSAISPYAFPDAVHTLCGSFDILWRPHGGPEIAARSCGGPGTGGEGMTEDCWTGEKEAAAESMKMEIESAFFRTGGIQEKFVSLSID